MIYSDVSRKIEKLRTKLYESINREGLNSKNTRKISEKLDLLINEYYKKEKEYEKDSVMIYEYQIAYDKLKQLTLDFGEFPSINSWNYYAKQNTYLNSESIKYISGLDWNKLRQKILYEIRKKL